MKRNKKLLIIGIALSLFIPLTGFGEATSALKAIDTPPKCENESNKLKSKIGREDFNFHLMELVTVSWASDSEIVIKNLVSELEELRSQNTLTFENRKDILYLIAECNYRLGNYDKAHTQFLHLKLLLKDHENKLYQEVQKKLKTAGIRKGLKKFSFAQLKKKLSDDNFIFLYVSGIIVILIGLFVIFDQLNKKFLEKISNPESSKNLDKKLKIVKNLISLPEMSKQDGRASPEAVEKEYETRGSSNSAYAGLLAEGYKMIEEVNTYIPYPLALVDAIVNLFRSKNSQSQTFKRPPLSWRCTYTIAAFVLIAVWVFLLIFPEPLTNKHQHPHGPISYCLFVALIISALTGLRIMAEKTINSLDEMVSMLDIGGKVGYRKHIEEIKRWMASLFRSPWQFFIAIVILALVYFSVLHLNKEAYPPYPSLYLILYTSLTLFVVPIIWFILYSLFIVDKISKTEDLAINPLSPLKTMGLNKWTSVIGTYATTGSFVLTFGCSIPAIDKYVATGELGDFFWLYIFIPLLIFYWIYPYKKLSGLVRSIKVKRMNFFKTRLSKIFKELVDSEEEILKMYEDNPHEMREQQEEKFEVFKPRLEQMEKYYGLFTQIDQSPDTYLDLNSALQLAQALGIPSLFALLIALLSGSL